MIRLSLKILSGRCLEIWRQNVQNKLESEKKWIKRGQKKLGETAANLDGKLKELESYAL